MRGSRIFRQFYLVLSLFYPEKSMIFKGGGGGPNFHQGGPNVTFYRNPYMYLLFSRGGVSGPPIPLWIRTWAMS